MRSGFGVSDDGGMVRMWSKKPCFSVAPCSVWTEGDISPLSHLLARHREEKVMWYVQNTTNK